MLTHSDLHASLGEPVMNSLNFLNEIISKFPNAISFAPGAPNPAHLCNIDIGKYTDLYIQHLVVSKHLTLEQAHRLLYQYGPARGLINELIAKTIKKDKGIVAPPEAYVITVGAQEAMIIVLRALFNSSKTSLAVVNPCFVGILGAAKLLDIDVIGIDETANGVDLEQLENACIHAQLNNKPIRALYVAPDYSNPAGTVLDVGSRLKLLKLAKQYDFFVIEDNAYGFTALPEAELPSLKALDTSGHVIFIGTFAKICLPGARVGYVIADQEVTKSGQAPHLLADDLTTIKSMITVNTSPICQALIAGMLIEQGGSLKALEVERSKLYQKNLILLLTALKQFMPSSNDQNSKVSWNLPTGGFFVRVRLPMSADIALLEYSASKYGVLWTPMSSFYLNNEGGNELRLSCSYLNSTQIEEGIKRFASFIHDII